METATCPLLNVNDCVLVLIDYQKEMFKNIRSSAPELIELNVRTLARAARAFGIPTILSTVGVKMGANEPTVFSLRKELLGISEIDRSSMNAWEDASFIAAVKATGRSRLVLCALRTEICLAFPVVGALFDGYEVCFVADAVGGESKVEHDIAIMRMVQAGAVPKTTCATIAEWFRDGNAPLATRGREILLSYWHDRAKLLRTSSELQYRAAHQ